jgi:hypothetical protein
MEPTTRADKLTPVDLKMFQKIRVDERLLMLAKIRRVSDPEACDILSRKRDPLQSMAGIQFPYHEPVRGTLVTSRIRRDMPDEDGGRKYMGSGFDRPHLYFPPEFATRFANGIAVVLVEGEKSALAVTAWAERRRANFLAVATGGCWNWRGKIGKELQPDGSYLPEKGPLPDLDFLNGHTVYILFDANAKINWGVQEAELRLIAELRKRECEVYVGRVPLKTGVNGPDDLIAAEGDSALDDVLQTAKLADSPEAFNDEFALVRDITSIAVLSSMNVLSVERFKTLVANRYYSVPIINKKGEQKTERRALGPAWLTWPGRRECERMVYEPGRNGSDHELNRWRGWGVKSASGDVTPWRMLLDDLFSGVVEKRKWFEQWCAYPLQYPGTKLKTSVVLWGQKQGTGKTTVGESLGRIYGRNFGKINEESLASQFNSWARDKQFILAEEVSSGDKRAIADRMKDTITGETLYINDKFVPAFSIRNTINLLFTSNHCNSFYIENEDRRYFVHNVVREKPEQAYWDAYYEWLDHHDGASHLFDHLLKLNLAFFHPHADAPWSEDKQEMVEHGRSDLEAWLREIKDSPDELCQQAGEIWESRKILAVFDPHSRTRYTSIGVGQTLTNVGFPKRRVKVGGRVLRLYSLREESEQRPSPEWAAEYANNHDHKPKGGPGMK